MFDRGKCEPVHVRFSRIELITLVHTRTVEASMHGSLDKLSETGKRIYQRWGIGFFALPVLVVIALIGSAITQPAAPNWISEVVRAEFAGSNSAPEVAPAQLAQPARETRTVRAN
jgi:hypothetical protein